MESWNASSSLLKRWMEINNLINKDWANPIENYRNDIVKAICQQVIDGKMLVKNFEIQNFSELNEGKGNYVTINIWCSPNAMPYELKEQLIDINLMLLEDKTIPEIIL